jgi:Kef-type K+ transport system membrane component KefB
MQQPLLKLLSGLILAICLIIGGIRQHIHEALVLGGIIVGVLVTRYESLLIKRPFKRNNRKSA